MQISDIQLWPLQNHKSLRSRGRFVLGNTFSINFTVWEGKNGLFVALPRTKGKDKDGNEKWYSDVYCKDESFKNDLDKKIIAAYEAEVEGSSGSSEDGENIPF